MNLRVCFVADANSPIAAAWINSIALAGADVHVVSSYPSDGSRLKGKSLQVVPIGFSGLRPSPASKPAASSQRFFRLRGTFVSRALNDVRRWVAPVEVWRHVPTTRKILDDIRPDVVHALRIPYEGLLASAALSGRKTPLVISSWGNDFTLHARRSYTLALATRGAMKRTDALHADCQRDARLAVEWGLSIDKPVAVLPGNGGLDIAFFSKRAAAAERSQWKLPAEVPIVLNPRGIRYYVRNETFFAAIPSVLERSKAHFVCIGMAGNEFAESQLDKLKIRDSVTLLPEVSRAEMRDLFSIAMISVSPSEHDGTPNTLLEAMACESFPIAGDIESIREWIVDQRNGLLCDPSSPPQLSDAIVRALGDESLRAKAASENASLIRQRADAAVVREKAVAFYADVVASGRSRR